MFNLLTCMFHKTSGSYSKIQFKSAKATLTNFSIFLNCEDSNMACHMYVLGHRKRSWDNILNQLERRNSDIVNALMDIKAAIAETCSKMDTLSF